MTNWWVLGAVLTELVGAALIARGLSLEKPAQWVRGRGTSRWGFEPDADLSYAASSTDAGVGFSVLVLGLGLQAINAIDLSARGSWWLLAVPIVSLMAAPRIAADWRHRRELNVMGIRIDNLVVEKRWSEDQWPVIVHGYSEALERVGRGPEPGDDAWAHLDRIYGENGWLPSEVVQGMRESYEVNVSITDREQLGNLWLPWYVRRDDGSQPIRDIAREQENARQLRVRDVVDNEAYRAALEEEYEDEGRRWTHLGRTEEYREQWSKLSGVSQGRFPAFRTADGPVLMDGCHRACAIYALERPDWRIDLELSEPPAHHPDTQPGPRDVALGRTNS